MAQYHIVVDHAALSLPGVGTAPAIGERKAPSKTADGRMSAARNRGNGCRLPTDELEALAVSGRRNAGGALEEPAEEGTVLVTYPDGDVIDRFRGGLQKLLCLFDTHCLDIGNGAVAGGRVKAALEGAFLEPGQHHHALDRMWLVIVVSEPRLAVCHDGIVVTGRSLHDAVEQLSLAVAVQEEDLRDLHGLRRTTEARDEVEGKILPGGCTSAGHDPLPIARHDEDPLRQKLHRWKEAGEKLGGGPVGCRFCSVEQAGRCEKDGACTNGAKHRSLCVLSSAPGDLEWPALPRILMGRQLEIADHHHVAARRLLEACLRGNEGAAGRPKAPSVARNDKRCHEGRADVPAGQFVPRDPGGSEDFMQAVERPERRFRERQEADGKRRCAEHGKAWHKPPLSVHFATHAALTAGVVLRSFCMEQKRKHESGGTASCRQLQRNSPSIGGQPKGAQLTRGQPRPGTPKSFSSEFAGYWTAAPWRSCSRWGTAPVSST